jgi:hypothetical protein
MRERIRQGRSRTDSQSAASPSVVHREIARGQTMPLPDTARTVLEEGFGHDLSKVRIHSDLEAQQMTTAAGAHALAAGNDIFFGPGGYAPDTADGLRLLAHEAAHAIQQSQGPVSGTPVAPGLSANRSHDAFEEAAETAADAIVSGRPAGSVTPASASTGDIGEGVSLQGDWIDDTTKYLGVGAGIAGPAIGSLIEGAGPWVSGPAAALAGGMYAGQALYNHTHVGPDTDMWMKEIDTHLSDPGQTPWAQQQAESASKNWDEGNYLSALLPGAKLAGAGVAAGAMGLVTGGIGYPLFHGDFDTPQPTPDPSWPPPIDIPPEIKLD